MPERTRSGERSLTRALGLKIGRIVIDAGHGGHDTGTIGPSGLMEKDLCLDIALRLGKLIQERLPGTEVTYTRDNDTFVPLEQRTEIANDARADLFLSVHANSSDDHRTSGIETYYLNFNASPQAMEVATRENATAQSSVHDLQELVTKIARNEKIEESRDLASDIQDSLSKNMEKDSHSERDRGVRKAPFVVLIGADMPSVLAEISFLSNPNDEQWLKKPENRQRIAEGLYRGVRKIICKAPIASAPMSPPQTRACSSALAKPAVTCSERFSRSFEALGMNGKKTLAIVCLLAYLLAGSTISVSAQTLLPDSFAGWTSQARALQTPANQAEQFAGNKAVILREYGLASAERRDYTQAKNSATVTLYRMVDPSAAFGAFTYLRAPEMAALGSALSTPYSATNRQRAVFVLGNLVLDIASPIARPADADLKVLAAGLLPHVDQRPFPEIAQFLPAQGLVPGSERYVLGPRALAEVFPSATAGSKDWLGFGNSAEAIVARYHLGGEGKGQEAVLLIALYPTQQVAADAYNSLGKWFALNAEPDQANGRQIVFGTRSGPLVAVLSGGGGPQHFGTIPQPDSLWLASYLE